MPPKDKKKGGKGKRGDDSDDDGIDPLAIMKKLANNDESEKPKESKPNKKEDKKDKKKKGGKHNDDSDDEEVPIAKPVKGSSKHHNEDEDEKPTKQAPTASKNNKKDKKKSKGGKRDDEDSDDDYDPIAKLAKANKHQDDDDDDDDEEEDIKPVKQAPAASKNNKKDKKKNKGGKRDDDDSDDDYDPLARLAKANKHHEEEDDDEEEEDIKPVKQAPTASKNNKKDKKKNKGGKRDDDDSDDDYDPLARLAKANKHHEEEDDDDEEEDIKPSQPMISKLTPSKDTPSKDIPTKSSNTKSKNASGQKTQKQDDDEHDDDNEKVEGLTSEQTASAKSEAITAHVPAQIVPELSKSIISPVSAAAAALVEKDTNNSTNSTHSSAPLPTPTSTPAVVSQPTTTGKSVIPPPAPAAPSAVPAPAKIKTKLEIKLEKLKQEKEAAAAAAAIVAAENEKIAKAEAEEKAKIQAAKDEEELVAKLAALELAAKQKAENATNEADEDEDDVEEEEAKDTIQSISMAEEEIEREKRMKATMFGDEVFSEYGHPTDGDNDGDSSAGGAGGSGRKKKNEKLSNKARRQLAKETEAKEREVEFNLLAMKRSMEGAQFAVSQSIIDPNDPQWQNALDIIIPSLSISAHNKELFVNTELNIVHGRRYGLVGPNGAGKSTLLKMIAAGELKIPPRIDYLYVEQEVVADETPAVDAVLKADKVRWNLVQEEKQLLKDLEVKQDDAKDTRLGEVYEQLNQIGASSAEARARRILFGLGFDAEMQVRPTKYFSGGWRMRISLARALFIEPTLLMLDEPTNHLDLNAVIWLDDYLQKWKKTLLIVSHDQDFLNSVCEEIIHLDDKKLVVYKGNYDNFKDLEEIKRKQQQKAWEKQEKRIREMKSKGITKEKAEKETLLKKSREPGARSKKADASAMSSGGAESGESQIELIKRPREYTVTFTFPEVVIVNPPLLEVRDVNFRYNPSLPWLFRDLNFGIDMTSRICIVGPNGSGKSTIIKLITGEVNPPEGEVRRNPRLRVGVYNQHFVDRLPMDEDPITYLRRLFDKETYQSCRNILGKYGLEGHAHTIPIRDLSGGQKARVVMVELSLMAPHLLFLDEPTNNLDIESIDALCIALKNFNGGVVLVSHDARLIETTNCQLWVVEDQNVTPWTQGFKDYRETLLRKLEEQLATIIPGGGERQVKK